MIKIAIQKSKACIQIEMAQIIESFNLATSTKIVLYKITKQRREFQKKNKRANKQNLKFEF